MKTFTALDKKVISKIIELYSNNNLNTLMNILFDIRTSVYGLTSDFYFSSEQNDSVTLYISKEVTDNHFYEMREFIPNIINTMTLIMRLFKYLIENDYLLIQKEKWDFSLGIISQDIEYLPFDQFDENLKKDIFSIGNSTFIPTEKLIVLEKNKFLDEDALKEIQAKRQNKITNRLSCSTIILSVLALVASIIFGIITVVKKNDVWINNKTITIDLKSDEVTSIQKDIEQIKRDIIEVKQKVKK